MDTDELIGILETRAKAHAPRELEKSIFAAAAVGAAAGFALLFVSLGVRSDLVAAVTDFPFLMKAVYAGATAAIAIALLGGLARPESQPAPRFAMVAIPFLALGLLTIGIAASNPAAEWSAFFMGMSAGECSVRIAAFAFPSLVVLMLAFRGFAPAHPARAGAAIGVAAGGIGALVYMFFCREVAAGFILVWYTLGILSMAALGALLGRFFLKWA